MSKWTFVSEDWPQPINAIAAEDLKNVRRDKLQAASDIYKVMQARMDGYRQSAAAVFIGILAAVLAFDSAFVRLLVDPAFWNPGNQKPDSHLAVVILVCGLLPFFVAGVGFYVIYRLGKYFAEMTSIIYKIDLANQVFTPDAWLAGKMLYPHKFIPTAKVSRGQEDQGLIGWWDPAIRGFLRLSVVIAIVHLVLYAFLAWHVWSFASIPPPVTNLPASTNSASSTTPSPATGSVPTDTGTRHD